MKETIDINTLEYLCQNEKIKKIVEEIINDNDNELYDRAYEKCRLLLEKINAMTLLKLGVQTEDYNIIKINKIYETKDKILFEETKSVILKYVDLEEDENEPTSHDIIYLLLKIDDIYTHIKNNYGEVIE